MKIAREINTKSRLTQKNRLDYFELIKPELEQFAKDFTSFHHETKSLPKAQAHFKSEFRLFQSVVKRLGPVGQVNFMGVTTDKQRNDVVLFENHQELVAILTFAYYPPLLEEERGK